MTDDAELMRLVEAHQRLDAMAQAVVRDASALDDLTPYGTDELPAAITALQTGLETGAVDQIVDGARWVARAFTATPMAMFTLGGGEAAFALCGGVMGLRADLLTLDEAAEK
ncbi:hypothetical protein [Kitasatospora kifunensis]|uniref:Uncharacterized protein n=1 Tax=Kitasatospora kifunensis TaxID=58351 RepID=A0A7W7RBT5_KITKI|nr:hypothetical protein [Kitasatospora kifunensis]MBB4929092.1 hypothetical protein [Kitasatospora kifunensis]